jgi:hypothetical protein
VGDPEHLFQHQHHLLVQPVLLFETPHLPLLIQTPNQRVRATDFYVQRATEVVLACLAAA